MIDMARIDALEARSYNEFEMTDVAQACRRRGQTTDVVTDMAQLGGRREED